MRDAEAQPGNVALLRLVRDAANQSESVTSPTRVTDRRDRAEYVAARLPANKCRDADKSVRRVAKTEPVDDLLVAGPDRRMGRVRLK